MEHIFKVGSQTAFRVQPPVLACRRCGAVMRPYPGVTEVACKCGKTYKLMSEGRPVERHL